MIFAVPQKSVIVGPKGEPLISAQRVKLEKQTRFNPLRNWTPDVLVRQLEAYARGEISQLAWVMDWLERHDDILSTVVPKAKGAVARWGYDVIAKPEVTREQKALVEEQQAVLQYFFGNLTTTDAIEREERGGMKLLVRQIMDAYGKGYSAHHIIWKPSRNGLTAELVKVPTWHFEVTDGEMKFLEHPSAMRGVGLETLGGRGAWLCAKGRGVMLAGALARMFKQIPLQDWLTYCDRHGMPAFIGQTNAQKGSQGWQDMADAVAAIGSEYGAVINTGDLIKTLDLATTGQLPYKELIERMDRAQIMLWMGGDLSTMSRENGTGSNPQQEDADELHGDNAEWVSEIINRGLSTQVLDYYFSGSPHLVELRLRTKIRQNQTQELAAVDHARKQGIRISKSWYISKFAVVEADDDEPALGEALTPPPAPAPAADPNAVNSAEGDTATMLKTALADAIGVRSQMLDGLDSLIADLAKRGAEDITDEEFLQFVEQAAMSLPELFSADAAHELFLNLEAALGTAATNGIRQSLSK